MLHLRECYKCFPEKNLHDGTVASPSMAASGGGGGGLPCSYPAPIVVFYMNAQRGFTVLNLDGTFGSREAFHSTVLCVSS